MDRTPHAPVLHKRLGEPKHLQERDRAAHLDLEAQANLGAQ